MSKQKKQAIHFSVTIFKNPGKFGRRPHLLGKNISSYSATLTQHLQLDYEMSVLFQSHGPIPASNPNTHLEARDLVL